MVKKNVHTRSQQGQLCHCQTAFGMPEDEFYLFAGHTRKPFQEIINARAVFEVLEQSFNRHAGHLEQPLAADLSRHPLYCRTLAPIKHEIILNNASIGCY